MKKCCVIMFICWILLSKGNENRFSVLSDVQEILKSLVAAPVDGGELGQESGPTPYHPDPALKTHPMLPMQFHSFDR